jgi:hypothetical protein
MVLYPHNYVKNWPLDRILDPDIDQIAGLVTAQTAVKNEDCQQKSPQAKGSKD